MRMRKCQKRPIIWQKRPITHTKETYRYIDIPEGFEALLALGRRDAIRHPGVAVHYVRVLDRLVPAVADLKLAASPVYLYAYIYIYTYIYAYVYICRS